MATKKTAAAQPAPEGVARDFVYAGVRMSSTGRLVDKIYLLDDQGRILDDKGSLYPAERAKRLIGGVYRGARFTDSQAIGLPSAKWTTRYYSEETSAKALMAGWDAQDTEARIEARSQAEEAKNKQSGHIDKLTLPLRRMYDDLRKRGDWAGAEALQACVMVSMRKGLRAEER